MSELVTSLRAVAWRVHNGEDVPPMEKALIDLCGQAADELVRIREAAEAVVAFHAPDRKRDAEACSKPMVALRTVLRDKR